MLLTKKQLWTGFLTLLLLFWGADLLIPQALALPNVGGNDYVKEVAGKLEIFHQFFSPLINLFARHIGNFLGNDHIFSGTMGEMLKNLWVISRNLVNIFFVFALLWIALKAIFGDFFGEETDLKKELLKIAVFLVVVNFSWLATKVVLDAANVATNVAFSLPSGVSNVAQVDLGQCSIDAKTGRISGPCKLTEDHFVGTATQPDQIQNLTDEECKTQQINEAYENVYPQSLNGNLNPKADIKNVEKYKDKTTFCWGKLDLFDYNQNTAVIYLTYGMAKIQNLGASFSLTQNLSKMAISSIFSLLLQVTFSLALAALFILMLVRTAMLWLFVGFSPVLVLMLYMGGEGLIPNFSAKDFIKWAFTPATVGIILSAGFIMIAAGQTNSDLMNTLNQNVNLKGGFYDSISIFSGLDTLDGLVWLILIELVFAIAVYIPMKDLPFAGSLIGPIADFAKNTLTSLAKTPLIAPILPTTDADGKPTSISLRDKFQDFQNKVEWREGLSADTKSIRGLEDQARSLVARDQDRTDRNKMLQEARRTNKSIETLAKYFDEDKLRKMDVDIQNSVLTTAGFTDDKERQDLIDALRKTKGSGSVSLSSSTPPASSSPQTATVPGGGAPAPADSPQPTPDPNQPPPP